MLPSAKIPSGSILTLSYPFTVIFSIPQPSKIALDTGPVTLGACTQDLYPNMQYYHSSLVFQQAALSLEGQISELGIPQ